MVWGLPMLFGSLAPRPIRRRMARTRPLLEDQRVMRMALHAQQNHPFRLPAPVPFTDDELTSVTAPTAVIVAGRSAPFSPELQEARAALIPTVTVEVVSDAGHEVSWSHVDLCLNSIETRR